MSRSSVLSPHMWSLLLLSSAVNQISPTRVDFWNSPLGHLRFWYLNPSLEMWKLLPNIICARYWDPLDIQHRLGPCMCLILIANCCTNRGWNTGTTLSFTCRERRTIVLGQWATCNVQRATCNVQCKSPLLVPQNKIKMSSQSSNCWPMDHWHGSGRYQTRALTLTSIRHHPEVLYINIWANH